MIWAILFFISLCVNAVAIYFLIGFIRRLMKAEDLINEMGDVADSLIVFCNTLKQKSLLYYSPEAQHFHKLVIKLSSPLEKISEKTKKEY